MTEPARKTTTAKLAANKRYHEQTQRLRFSLHKEKDAELIAAIEQYKAECKGTDMSVSKLVTTLLEAHFEINPKKIAGLIK